MLPTIIKSIIGQLWLKIWHQWPKALTDHYNWPLDTSNTQLVNVDEKKRDTCNICASTKLTMILANEFDTRTFEGTSFGFFPKLDLSSNFWQTYQIFLPIIAKLKRRQNVRILNYLNYSTTEHCSTKQGSEVRVNGQITEIKQPRLILRWVTI